MFKKLLKNLSFNPSLIEQIPGHIKTVKKERAVRVSALLIFCLAIAVQIYITASPSQPTLTSSPNDLISGGFNTKSQATNDCINNIDGYKALLIHYSVTCSNLQNASSAELKSTAYNNQLYSISRLGYGRTGETSITIANQTYWLRPLSTWDKFGPTTYHALSGSSQTGATFAVLYNSGNLVLVGPPKISSPSCQQPSKVACAALSISVRNDTRDTNNANNTTAKSGDELIYTAVATNPTAYPLNNYRMQINFASVLAYANLSNPYLGNLANGLISLPPTTLNQTQTITYEVAFIINKPIPNTPVSSTDPGYYNLKMTTVFGNSTTVNLPWSFSKYTEIVLNNGLPPESQTTSLIIVAVIGLAMLYFVARNSLLLSELDCLKDDYLNNDRK